MVNAFLVLQLLQRWISVLRWNCEWLTAILGRGPVASRGPFGDIWDIPSLLEVRVYIFALMGILCVPPEYCLSEWLG